MITVYVILSEKSGWIYVGMTNNLERRLHEHNSGYNLSTKSKRPFKLIHQEIFDSRINARKAEKYYKSAAGKRKLRMIMEGLGPV